MLVRGRGPSQARRASKLFRGVSSRGYAKGRDGVPPGSGWQGKRRSKRAWSKLGAMPALPRATLIGRSGFLRKRSSQKIPVKDGEMKILF